MGFPCPHSSVFIMQVSREVNEETESSDEVQLLELKLCQRAVKAAGLRDEFIVRASFENGPA